MSAALQLVQDPFSGKVFGGIDFSGQDLTKKRVRNAIFRDCNFDDANMAESDFEFCDFTGSTFRRTNCYMTSFKRSKMAATVFAPKDAFGMTMTFDCKTFENMHLSQQWWYFWLMLIASTDPDKGPVKEPVRDNLIAAIGAERYVRLKKMLQCRDI